MKIARSEYNFVYHNFYHSKYSIIMTSKSYTMYKYNVKIS